ISYVVADEGIVFTGDALFAGSIGGTSSDKRKAEQIAHIRAKIFALPDETLVCSGHGPASTVGTEKACNPFFV
ncbi:MAG: MBL fold metallo-hydrolase, partial [Candidatus Sumerlaeota bacterium]|nr:MBL fold metallo-hydrolase [Candidatus Sumerlaeota bacterium]